MNDRTPANAADATTTTRSPTWTRRRMLSGLGIAGAVFLAGCTGGATGAPDGAGDDDGDGGDGALCADMDGAMEPFPADSAVDEARFSFTFDYPAGWTPASVMSGGVTLGYPETEGVAVPPYTIDVFQRDQPATEDEARTTLANDDYWRDGGTITFDGETRQVLTHGTDAEGPHRFAVVLPEYQGNQTYWNWISVSAGRTGSTAGIDGDAPPCHPTLRKLAGDLVGSMERADRF